MTSRFLILSLTYKLLFFGILTHCHRTGKPWSVAHLFFKRSHTGSVYGTFITFLIHERLTVQEQHITHFKAESLLYKLLPLTCMTGHPVSLNLNSLWWRSRDYLYLSLYLPPPQNMTEYGDLCSPYFLLVWL